MTSHPIYTDPGSGVKFHVWIGDPNTHGAVGLRCVDKNGNERLVYFQPSDTSLEGRPNVFVYQGDAWNNAEYEAGPVRLDFPRPPAPITPDSQHGDKIEPPCGAHMHSTLGYPDDLFNDNCQTCTVRRTLSEHDHLHLHGEECTVPGIKGTPGVMVRCRCGGFHH